MLSPVILTRAFSLRNTSLRGDELDCSCPFAAQRHKGMDDRPSFGINLTTGACHCFGCQWSGSVFTLATELLGCTPSDATHLLVPDLDAETIDAIIAGGSYHPQGTVAPIEAEVDRWASTPTDYWDFRGVDRATQGRWRLGFDPIERRAVIPIYMDHQLVGWTKRRIVETEQPKWKNSPGFEKSSVLFGLDEASGPDAILVEAPLSAIKLWQQGIRGAVASFGCSLSERQASILRARFDRVLVFYDPDKAGREGTYRACSMLAPHMEVLVAPRTRDDPAANTPEENLKALTEDSATRAWAWMWGRSAFGKKDTRKKEKSWGGERRVLRSWKQ